MIKRGVPKRQPALSLAIDKGDTLYRLFFLPVPAPFSVPRSLVVFLPPPRREVLFFSFDPFLLSSSSRRVLRLEQNYWLAVRGLVARRSTRGGLLFSGVEIIGGLIGATEALGDSLWNR